MENVSVIIAVCSFVLGAAGFIFKYWIIEPLSGAITRLDKNVERMQDLIDTMQEKEQLTREVLARLEERVDSLEKRVNGLQERQFEVLKKVKI